MAIRMYKKEDYDNLINVCLDTEDLNVQKAPIYQYIKLMFCRYYIEKEPENCVVVTDENDKAVGYVFGASDYKAGSCGSVVNLFDLPYNHKPEVVEGFMQEECSAMLTEFFADLRKRKNEK